MSTCCNMFLTGSQKKLWCRHLISNHQGVMHMYMVFTSWICFTSYIHTALGSPGSKVVLLATADDLTVGNRGLNHINGFSRWHCFLLETCQSCGDAFPHCPDLAVPSMFIGFCSVQPCDVRCFEVSLFTLSIVQLIPVSQYSFFLPHYQLLSSCFMSNSSFSPVCHTVAVEFLIH